MENVLTRLDNLDFMLEVEDLFVEEHDSCELMIVACLVTDRFINPGALLK